MDETGAERRRTVTWHDPARLAAAGRGLAGIDFLQAMARGDLPPPPIMGLANFALASIAAGVVVMELDPDESQYNPIGTVHGGIIATVLDSVMGCAVHSTLPAGRAYTTLELKVNYVRPVLVSTGRLTAEGRVIHAGRQTATAEAKLLDAGGKLYAHATTTCLAFDTPPAPQRSL